MTPRDLPLRALIDHAHVLADNLQVESRPYAASIVLQLCDYLAERVGGEIADAMPERADDKPFVLLESKVWCDQCERLTATSCASQFCKIKPAEKQNTVVELRPNLIAKLTGTDLVKAVAQEFGLHYQTIIRARRDKHLHLARMTVMQIMTKRGLTTTKIAQFLNRDHSTIVHGLGVYERKATELSRAIVAKYAPRMAA